MSRTFLATSAALGVALIALLLGVGKADANFPGRNGAVAFDFWAGTNMQIGLQYTDGTRTSLTSTFPLSAGVPRWSLDGTKIAFHAYPEVNRAVSDVWVMDADGQNKLQLTNTSVREEVPAWTSDGRIVYCGQSPETLAWGVYRINANGSGLTALINNADEFSCWPAPASHGTKIAVTRWQASTGMQIWTMDVNGNGLRRVTSGDQASGQPDWSPTGNDIVFVRDTPDGHQHVWLVHSDGTGLRQLTHTADRYESFPNWAPDGSKVLFVGNEADGPGVIYSVNPRTGVERTVVAPDPPVSWSVGYPAWQPLPAEDNSQ